MVHCWCPPPSLSYTLSLILFLSDYSQCSALIWGKGAGCDFTNSKCLNPGVNPTVVSGGSDWWCASSETTGCDFLRLGRGYCNVDTNIAGIPSYNQYWSGSATTGGSSDTMNRCPYIRRYGSGTASDCHSSASAPAQNLYGQTYGKNSLGFLSAYCDEQGMPRSVSPLQLCRYILF